MDAPKRGLEAGRYAVHCEAHILDSGYAAKVFCYSMAEPAPANLIRAVIDAAKRARYVPAFRLDRLNGAGPKVMQALEQDARRELFVPGYHEGRPVAMLYVEPIFDYR